MEYDDVRQAVDFAKREGLLEGQRKGQRKGKLEGKRESIEQGIEQGIKQGIKQERIRLVKRFRLANMSIKQIAELCSLTEEQISAIIG
ncbi:MAG: hypothetical protein LBB79_04960 [Prevotellaceae bacterium]|nr:hypothetical protein [Prevotellaceae bacterium]